MLNAMRAVPEKKQDWRKGTSSVPLTGKISQRMKYLMVADIVRNSDKDSVVLTVHREGAEDAMEITVPVTDVELPSVFHEMLDSKIGYIRITQFTGVTGEQYQEAFDDLQKQGMEKMIVDLRDNPGGLLDSVCDILRKILPEGLIVYTEDKDGNREEEKCDGKNETPDSACSPGK